MFAYVDLPPSRMSMNNIATCTALDPCIAAANGGCDSNAKCVMTGPGLVSVCVCVCVCACVHVRVWVYVCEREREL